MNAKLEEFLMMSFFGFKNPEDETKTIEVCCKHAYQDMCRTLRFSKEKDHKDWSQGIISVIVGGIKGFDFDPDKYDSLYDDLCSGVISYANKGSYLCKEFEYGQVQKLVNMTFKYLYLLDYKNIERLKNKLHIPVDNYIIDVAKAKSNCDEESNAYSLGIDLPEGCGNAWSTWKENNYRNFETQVKSKIIDRFGNEYSPIEWECLAWAEQVRLISAKDREK